MQYSIMPLTKHGNAKYVIRTGKYVWLPIINQANNKHNGITKKKNKNKGPRILLSCDISIKREIDFGFIRMIYEQLETPIDKNENQIGGGGLKCLKCGNFYSVKQAIISHISHIHHEHYRTTDLKCPYYPKTFTSTTTLKIHIRARVCTKRKEIQVCEINKLRTHHQFNAPSQ